MNKNSISSIISYFKLKKHFMLVLCCLLLSVELISPNYEVNAKEKRIITQNEVDEARKSCRTYGMPVKPKLEDYDTYEEYDKAFDLYLDQMDVFEEKCLEYEEQGVKLFYQEVLTYDGAYQENGLKIYTVMNNTTKTIKKTGAYSIIVGGTTVKKNQGNVKFVAPSDGTYKIVLDVRENIAAGEDGIVILPYEYTKKHFMPKVLYSVNGVYERNPNTADLILVKEGSAGMYKSGGISDYISASVLSEMRVITGRIEMKKGEYIVLKCRSSEADLNRDYAYDIAGFDLTITKE